MRQKLIISFNQRGITIKYIYIVKGFVFNFCFSRKNINAKFLNCATDTISREQTPKSNV